MESPTAQLTPMQMRMLALCAQGLGREEIGATLFLSPWTVKRYLSDARELLHARNNTHAVAICILAGDLGVVDFEFDVAEVETELDRVA